MGTIVSNGSRANATVFGSQRKSEICSNGKLWDLAFAYQSNDAITAVSGDGGSTWSSVQTYTGATALSYVPNGSWDVADDDSIHMVYKDRSDGRIQYKRGLPNAARTAWTWYDFGAVFQSSNFDVPDITAHTLNGGTVAHIVAVDTSNGGIYYNRVTFDSGGNPSLFYAASGAPQIGTSTTTCYVSIDHQHNGDGKTVSGVPNLFVGWSTSQSGLSYGLRWKKITYTGSGTMWTFGTERQIDTARYSSDQYQSSFFYDGSRVIMAGFFGQDNSPYVRTAIYEMDPADTGAAATVRYSSDPTGGPDYYLWGCSTHDSAGNVYIFGVNTNNPKTINRLKWERSTGTASVTTHGTLTGNGNISARRGAGAGALDYVYTDGNANPRTITSGRIVLNTAPNAATASSPTGSQRVDRTQATPLVWTFSDPDAGDSQSRADVRYRVPAVTSTWTTVTNTATTGQTYSLPANTFTAEQSVEWQALVYDSQGVPAGSWSSSAFFTASDPTPAPTITAPTSGGTIATSSYLVQWSSANQDAYQLRRVADGAGQAADTSTVYFDTGVQEDSTSRARTVTFETNNRVEHVQVRVRKGGLWSPWADVRATVSFTPPATPTLVLTAVKTNPTWLGTDAIDVAITNPAPTGSQPTVVSHDVLVDDGTVEGLRRVATGIAPGGTWRHPHPAAGRDYASGRIRIVAVAANGTTSTASS